MDNLPIADGIVGNSYYQTLFDVKEVPAPYPANLGGFDRETGYKFIVDTETGNIISCMTNNYKLVKNKEIIELATESIIKNNGILTEANTFSKRRTMYKFKFPDMATSIGSERIFPQIIIKNSYDGTIGVNIMAGAFRLVCLNGMIIGKIFSELSNRHLETNDALKELNLLIEQTIEKSNLYITKNIMSLSELEVTDRGHILKTVQMFPLKAQDRMIEYLQRNKINTYWDLLNSATWVATHVLSRNIEATHKLEEQILSKVLSLSNIKGNA